MSEKQHFDIFWDTGAHTFSQSCGEWPPPPPPVLILSYQSLQTETHIQLRMYLSSFDAVSCWGEGRSLINGRWVRPTTSTARPTASFPAASPATSLSSTIRRRRSTTGASTWATATSSTCDTRGWRKRRCRRRRAAAWSASTTTNTRCWNASRYAWRKSWTPRTTKWDSTGTTSSSTAARCSGFDVDLVLRWTWRTCTGKWSPSRKSRPMPCVIRSSCTATTSTKAGLWI